MRGRGALGETPAGRGPLPPPAALLLGLQLGPVRLRASPRGSALEGRPPAAVRGLGHAVINAGVQVRVLTAGPLSAADAATRVFAGGALVVLAVAIFILGVGDEEPDGALVQPAGVCRGQAVAAGPRARAPGLAGPVSGSASLWSAAEHQPVGGARGPLEDRLRPR